MTLLTRFITYLFCYTVLVTSLFAQDNAISLKDRGSYYEVILDYTTGISHLQTGKFTDTKKLVLMK